MNLCKSWEEMFYFCIEMTVQKLYLPISSTMIINTKPLVFTDLPNTNGSGTRKTIVFDLPSSFLEAGGPKWIHVRHVKVLYYDNLPADVKVHSSIVSLSPYDDSFACFANETLVKPKKFQYNSSDKTISFWFKNMKGEEVPISAFVIELLLQWTSKNN
jgi:hypothetical protein